MVATIKTIQRRLLKLLASKAEGVRWLQDKQRRGDWDYSASIAVLSSELCALKDACQAAEIDEWRIHEAINPTRAARKA